MPIKITFKKKLKSFFRFLLKYIYPSLYKLESNKTYFDNIQTKIVNSQISVKANISELVQINSSKIDDYTYVSTNAKILLTKVGKFCSIGPNVFCGWGVHPTNGLSTSPAFYSLKKQVGVTFSNENKIIENLPIEIGNDVFIGMNVTILDGVTIGDGAIIGAGAVVSKNIPPYAVAVGSPIRIIKYRFNPLIIEKLLKIKWWDFDEIELKKIEKYFFNIEEFIAEYDKN